MDNTLTQAFQTYMKEEIGKITSETRRLNNPILSLYTQTKLVSNDLMNMLDRTQPYMIDGSKHKFSFTTLLGTPPFEIPQDAMEETKEDKFEPIEDNGKIIWI